MQERPDVDVRLVDLEDAGHQRAIIELLDAYAREPQVGGIAFSAEVRARLISELRKQSAGRYFLAFHEAQAVGVAICFMGFSTFYAQPLLNIHDLAVRDGFRGLGIGRTMLMAIEAEAKSQGCCKVTLEVRADNPGARRLYEDVGFSAGETSSSTFAFMTKKLDDSPSQSSE